MVATIAAGTSAGYYLAQSEYYLGGGEPPGTWIATGAGFGIVDGGTVERKLFERLHAATDADGKTLLSNGGKRIDRVPGYDVTFSAPKSVSVLWALCDKELRGRIEVAQAEAVKAAIRVLEKNAAVSRRGRNGLQSEAVDLSVAAFQHGEARPTEHSDGRIFADPQLHTHAVILNLARRADGTVGTLDGRRLFAWKMAAGAAYHLALASNLQELGLGICDIGRNGMFEIADVEAELVKYFSARRAEVEAALDEAGLTSAAAPALAGAITKASREAKAADRDADRFALWRDIAHERGHEADRLVETALQLHNHIAELETEAGREQAVADRLRAVPEQLTQSESVFERRHLVAAVASALVGSGLPVDRAERAVEALIDNGCVVELGTDAIGEMRFSTPVMIRIEREILAMAQTLSARSMPAPYRDLARQLVDDNALNSEQAEAVAVATSANAIAVIEGAAGSGKTTSLRPIVEAHRAAGYHVIGSATAWRIAHQLRDDLGIEAKATDVWLAGHAAGRPFLDDKTLLVVDEAGQLSSRQMHAVLSEVERSGAKLVLVGDRRQLQPIGAGGALSIVARATAFAHVDQVVRQREEWARQATMALAAGKTVEALSAYAEHGHVHLHTGPKDTVQAMVETWERSTLDGEAGASLLLARTNGQVREINAAVRTRLRAAGTLRGPEMAIDAVTASSQAYRLDLAVGEEIRFLARHDSLGVINGTTAIVTALRQEASGDVKIGARIGNRDVSFTWSELADDSGKARLAHAYASTIYGAQGLTADRAFVLIDPACDRHDAYVGLSRARDRTEIFADRKLIDAGIRAEQPLSQRAGMAEPETTERLAWLGGRLSRAGIKGTTLDLLLPQPEESRQPLAHRQRQKGHSHEIELA
jgi:conjugative relaxase-like TrwC/TraI family protein